MRRKCGLFITGLLLSGMMYMGVACATELAVGDSVTGTWVWSGTGLSYTFGGEFLAAGNENYSFGITVASGPISLTNSISLISSTNVFSTITVTGNANDGYTAQSGSETLDLGDSDDHRYYFDDGENDPTSYYTITRDSTISYTLSSVDGLVFANLTAPGGTPTAVPIPGSLILIGTSLVGLMAIGGRKVRA